jgi:hypothetical protein
VVTKRKLGVNIGIGTPVVQHVATHFIELSLGRGEGGGNKFFLISAFVINDKDLTPYYLQGIVYKTFVIAPQEMH